MIDNNNTSIFLEKTSKYESAPRFTTTPNSRGSIERSFDNLNIIENKNLTSSAKSTENLNYQSPQYRELEKPSRDSYKNSLKESFKESYHKDPFRESSKESFKGAYSQSFKENQTNQNQFNSNQINHNYQSPKPNHYYHRPSQINQINLNNQTNQLLGNSNLNKSFSTPLNETDLGLDYKKEYEKLLSKVEEQEKQLV